MLVAIDGPSGVGKTTTVKAVHALLDKLGVPVTQDHEPAKSPVGQLACSLFESASGPTLACLFAADRHLHLQTVIEPTLATGRIVLLDRYLLSGLSMQRFDGVTLDVLKQVNASVRFPDIQVVLLGDGDVVSARLQKRGLKNRYQRRVSSTAEEIVFYREAAEELRILGVQVEFVDTTRISTDVAARQIVSLVNARIAAHG